MKIRIEITKGPDSGREFVLSSNDRLTIGRGGEAEIQMSDELISREHCEIKSDGMRLLLRDLGSTNKTFLAQGNIIDSIEPKQFYEVTHGNSFFAGPESRFTATYLADIPSQPQNTQAPEPPPIAPGEKPAGGNFSNSIQFQSGGAEWADSSIFNLLGRVPQGNSLEDSCEFNNPSPPPGQQYPNPVQNPQPSQPADYHDYERGSISAPSDQGFLGREQAREQIYESPPNDRNIDQVPPSQVPRPPAQNTPPQNEDSGVFSRSIDGRPFVSPQDAPPRALPPHEQTPAPYEEPPTRRSQAPIEPPPRSSNPIENESIVPPHLQGIGHMREQVEEQHDDSYLKSTPKIADPKRKKAPPTLRAPEKHPQNPREPAVGPGNAFSESIGHSIATPGRVYESRPPVRPAEPTNMRTKNSIEPAPQTEPVLRQEVPTVLAATPESTREQENGLFFHTSMDLANLDGLMAELSAQSHPIFCVDFSRLEIEPPTREVANQAPASEKVPNEPEEVKPQSAPPQNGGESAFELESDDDNSVFELDEEVEKKAESNSGATGNAEKPKLIGVPLFDFLPKGHKQNGPLLLSQPQFKCSLADVWQQDAVVIFFGPDPRAVTEHLQKLLHTNIQTGKQFKGMFGFCWPSVLHSLFEVQGSEQVKHVFGESITHVLLEDPLQRHAWNLVARSDQTGSIKALINN